MSSRVNNFHTRQRLIGLEIKRLQEQATSEYRWFIRSVFERILEQTPQFSGMGVANWNIGINSPNSKFDDSLGDDISRRDVDKARQKGDRYWIDVALKRNEAALNSIKPSDTVYITNSTLGKWAKKGRKRYYIEDMQQNWQQMLRAVNRPYEVAAESAAIIADAFRVGSRQRLPNVHWTEGDKQWKS